MDLAYVHLVEPRTAGNVEQKTTDTLAPFRAVYKGTLIAAGGYKREEAMDAVSNGVC